MILSVSTETLVNETQIRVLLSYDCTKRKVVDNNLMSSVQEKRGSLLGRQSATPPPRISFYWV
jgi:hypothetical protein